MNVKPRNLKSPVTERTSSALLRSETAELDQTGFVRMKRQRKPPQPFPHRVQEAPGIALMLAADDKIVGIPDDDHVARGFAPSLALGPEVEGVVQVDVGQERRDGSSNAIDNLRCWVRQRSHSWRAGRCLPWARECSAG